MAQETIDPREFADTVRRVHSGEAGIAEAVLEITAATGYVAIGGAAPETSTKGIHTPTALRAGEDGKWKIRFEGTPGIIGIAPDSKEHAGEQAQLAPWMTIANPNNPDRLNQLHELDPEHPLTLREALPPGKAGWRFGGERPELIAIESLQEMATSQEDNGRIVGKVEFVPDDGSFRPIVDGYKYGQVISEAPRHEAVPELTLPVRMEELAALTEHSTTIPPN